MQKLFGLNFYDLDVNCLGNELKDSLTNELSKKIIYTPNVDHIITVKENNVVNKAYKNADLLIADGWPLVSVSKLKKKKIFKITGVELMERLLKMADDSSLKLFFLGSTDYTLETMSQNIKNKYTKINDIAFYNGYFTDDENEEIINLINKNKTDILFVGMGHPKQEIWIDENRDKLNIKIAVAVGGAFKIFSEEIKRAPELVQKIKMEWLWRFMKEPKRLFSRYFIRYPRFLKIAFREISNR